MSVQLQARGLQRLPGGELRAVEQVLRHLLELFARHFDAHRLALVVATDRDLAAGRERALGVFAFAPQPAGRVRVFARVEAVRRLELLGHVVDQPLVPIVAAELHVAVGRQGDELVPRISITVTSNVPPPRS